MTIDGKRHGFGFYAPTWERTRQLLEEVSFRYRCAGLLSFDLSQRMPRRLKKRLNKCAHHHFHRPMARVEPRGTP